MFEVATSGKTKLNITPGDAQLSLSWSPVSGAVAYQVWYSNTNDLGLATQWSVDLTVTSQIITGLANGTVTYVWVKVLYEAGGTAQIIASGSGIPYIIPSPPIVNTPTPNTTTISVSWANSSGATAYEVWYSTINDTATAVQQGGDIASLNYNITGLTTATTYNIWVKAKNVYGTSGFSIVRTVNTL